MKKVLVKLNYGFDKTARREGVFLRYEKGKMLIKFPWHKETEYSKEPPENVEFV